MDKNYLPQGSQRARRFYFMSFSSVLSVFSVVSYNDVLDTVEFTKIIFTDKSETKK